MIVVEIINRVDDRVLSSELHVADTIGMALDGFAPDPADSAVFEVRVVGRVAVAKSRAGQSDG